MTRFSLGLASAFVVWTFAPLDGQQPSTTFRSGVDAVVVPVWVTSGNRPVPHLTAADFRLFDNGVAQELSLSSVESLAIDVSVVLDASGSVTGPALERFKSDIQEIAHVLRTTDRIRVILFATAVADLSGWQPGGTRLQLDDIESGGLTAFYNALVAALISSARGDRPHLVVGFSDGLDTSSFLDANDLISVAGASMATLYLVLDDQISGGGILTTYTGGPAIGSLKNAVERTGGWLFRRPARTALPASFKQVLQDFRSGYVLSYAPRGVARGGWHEITVRTTNAGHTVRAKKGYDGR